MTLQLRMAELDKQSLRLDSARRTHYKVSLRCRRMVTTCGVEVKLLSSNSLLAIRRATRGRYDVAAARSKGW